MYTQAEIKAAFSGSHDNKAGFQAKVSEVNAKFHLNLPQEGTLTMLKAVLKAAKAELMEQVRRCLHALQADRLLQCVMMYAMCAINI